MGKRNFYNEVKANMNSSIFTMKGKKIYAIYKELQNSQLNNVVRNVLFDYVSANFADGQYINCAMVVDASEEEFMKRILGCDELVSDFVITDFKNKANEFLCEVVPNEPACPEMKNNLIDNWFYRVTKDGHKIFAEIISNIGFLIGCEPYDTDCFSETDNYKFAKDVLNSFVRKKLQRELDNIDYNFQIHAELKDAVITNIRAENISKMMAAIPVVWKIPLFELCSDSVDEVFTRGMKRLAEVKFI